MAPYRIFHAGAKKFPMDLMESGRNAEVRHLNLSLKVVLSHHDPRESETFPNICDNILTMN